MLRISAIAAFAFALTGCGTVQNFQRDSVTDATVYGGVQIARAPLHEPRPGDWLGSRPLLWQLSYVDMAASAVGDTLTLPVTVPLATWRVGSRLWYLANYNNDDPLRNKWREFWFNDEPPPERVHGGIY